MGFEGFDRTLPLKRFVKRRRSDRRAQLDDSNVSGRTGADDSSNRSGEETSLALAANRELLQRINEFVLKHRLDVNPFNLTMAHAALSGSDRALGSKVKQRELAGETITQKWLEGLAKDQGTSGDQRQQVDQMMGTLERSIAAFAATTESARSATAGYRGEFSQHLDQADMVAREGAPQDMLTISRAMLNTLQRIEVSMKQSQIETEQLQERLSEARAEADSDHLTGLPNRRAFERELYSAHRKALEGNLPLFLAIADIDHFKQVNDTFGHETGDRLLKAIAQILKRYASKDCFVARHGGEEFVLLIHAQNIQEAFKQLERARCEVEGRKFVARQQKRPIGQITFSAGLADVMATANPRDALAAADDGLYAAKGSGRNRIVVVGQPPCGIATD